MEWVYSDYFGLRLVTPLLRIDSKSIRLMYNGGMATKLDFAFRRLETVVDEYCIAGKEDDAIEAVTWAWEYAHDFPQAADIQEAISLVKKAENYMSAEGKPLYAEVRAEVVKRLRLLLHKRKKMEEPEIM
jgi:hypothetical protein